jgi:hypothetical protein
LEDLEEFEVEPFVSRLLGTHTHSLSVREISKYQKMRMRMRIERESENENREGE